MKFHCAIGSQVALVPQHWLRPYERGIVVEQQRQALKKWLVQFPDAYDGGGIGGDKIWCDEGDFAEVIPAQQQWHDAESAVGDLVEARRYGTGDHNGVSARNLNAL